MKRHKAAAAIGVLAAVSFVAGGICLGAGIAKGGTSAFYYDEEGLHALQEGEFVQQDYVQEKVQISPVKNVEISLDYGDVELVSTDSFYLEYVLEGERFEPEVSWEDGNLILRENENYRERAEKRILIDPWGITEDDSSTSPYVRIGIPEGTVFENVEISLHYGEVKISELSAQSVQVSLDYGELDMSVGEVGWLDVEAKDGKVSLDLKKAAEEYGVSLCTRRGSIRTPEGIVTGDEEGEGPEYLRLKEGKASIFVELQDGDIRIHERQE